MTLWSSLFVVVQIIPIIQCGSLGTGGLAGGRSVRRGGDLGTTALIHQRGAHTVILDAQVHERARLVLLSLNTPGVKMQVRGRKADFSLQHH